MTLKEYAKQINELAKQNPDALVVYSSDDEGNSFSPVHYAGTFGFFNNRHKEFHSEDNVKEDPDSYEDYVGKKPDAICIN